MARERIFDELDVALVKELQVDGRASNTELARRLGVTETTVRNRINRLLREELIVVAAFPTAKALTNKLSVVMAVAVEPAHLHAAAKAVCEHREVRYVSVTDRFELRLEVYLDDRDDIYRFIRDRLAPLPGVTGVEAEVVLRTLKYSHEWDPEQDLA